jgi:hypothetical protein
VVDAFSKYVAFYPVQRISARVVVDCLERGFFPAYGTPKYVVTDNAMVFCCKNLKDLCFRWGVEHLTMIPYYPQASLAERISRNMEAALKIFHHDSQSAWDKDLLWLSMAFNTAVHESTQGTLDLFWGREMRCPFGVHWDMCPVNSGHVNGADRSFLAQVYNSLKHASRKVALNYNRGRGPRSFKAGDIVRYRLKPVSSKAREVSAKMMLRW